MKLGVVLGAGGLVGVAHHVGVLRALEDEADLREEAIGLMVGTSAGSAIAAYLRSGWTTTELVERAGDLRSAAPGSLANGAVETLRRGIGSAYIVARTAVRVPSILSFPPMPFLRRAFPAGLASMGSGGSMLDRELPRTWPERPLWLVAYDLVGRRRVVLGRKGEPYLPLPAAVRASCAIPGVYAPVRGGGGVLVDGGAWSLTNIDLTAIAGCDEVICISPMSYDTADAPGPGERALRELATRSLSRSVQRLRREGRKVVVLAPGAKECRVHGFNFMRSEGLEEVALVAYEETVRKLRRGGPGKDLSKFDLSGTSSKVPPGQSFSATAAR